MPQSHDIYPTRIGEKQPMFPRQDPTVHARNQRRWEGPLDEEALSRFERDGFIWFEGFFSRERTEPFFDDLREMARDESMMASPRSSMILNPRRSARCSRCTKSRNVSTFYVA